MRTRTLALAALVLLAVPAHAAPSAAVGDGAEASFRLATRGGTYRLHLLATAPAQGGAPVLRLRIESPSGSTRLLAGTLPPGAFATSGTGATLRTRLGAQTLQVVWTAGSGVGNTSVGGLGEGSAVQPEGWSTAGRSGLARLRLGSLSCTTQAVVLGPVVSYQAQPYGGSLSRGIGVDLRGAACGTA
jgi:hypothetical protein